MCDKNMIQAEDLEFVAECRETEERVVFTMADLYGWDDETVFLDTSIYLNQPKKVNWDIVCKSVFGRRLNPEYNIHIRTQEDKQLIEPLRIVAIKKYAGYRFEAAFSNHVVRTGCLQRKIRQMEEPPFCEDEFEFAEMNSRGILVKKVIFISAKTLWKMSDEYVHYGCNADGFDMDEFCEVKNIPFSTKPLGGFWASPTSVFSFGWERFCREQQYQPRMGLERKFYFCLDINANVFRMKSINDYHALPKTDVVGNGKEFIDFEACVCQGIDAIEYVYSVAHKDKEIGEEMDIRMMGWDCDSILILNPAIILRESLYHKCS